MGANDVVNIFDTTLRDGEQSPGASMNIDEKVIIARQLEKLGVDVIEAGFAASSPGDFESVVQVCKAVKRPIVLSLARAQQGDIRKAAKAVEGARKPGLHTFIATSDIHMKHKLPDVPGGGAGVRGYGRGAGEEISGLCRVLRGGRFAQRSGVLGGGLLGGHPGRGENPQHSGHHGLRHPVGVRRAGAVPDRKYRGLREGHLERPLPQRPGSGRGQLPGRRWPTACGRWSAR